MNLESFDLNLNLVGAQASAPSAEEIKSGAPPVVAVSLTVAIALPFQTAQGPAIAPVGKLHFALPKDQAIEIGKAAEALPEPSDLTIATDLGEATKLAKDLKKLS